MQANTKNNNTDSRYNCEFKLIMIQNKEISLKIVHAKIKYKRKLNQQNNNQKEKKKITFYNFSKSQ